jgi:hypothetical protein
MAIDGYFVVFADDRLPSWPQLPPGVDRLIGQEINKGISWTPITIDVTDGPILDYMYCLGIHVFTPRLRELFDSLTGPEDGIEWLPMATRSEDGVVEPSWAMRLTRFHPEVIHRGRSTFAPDGGVIVRVIDRDKAKGLNVFADSIYVPVFWVSDKVRRAVRAAKFTGIKFEGLRSA